MNQIVKIQMNADITDVTELTALTMEQVTFQVEELRKVVVKLKSQLRETDILSQQDREQLKQTLPQLDAAKELLSKIDMRLGDIASITSGLVSVFEPKQKEPEIVADTEESNDIVSTR
jgi:hypothetical protein